MKINIPSSFIGYKKASVNQILNEKNKLLETQNQDIEYLRNENKKLKKQLKIKNKKEKSPEPEA